MGVQLNGEAISRTLGNANETAKHMGAELASEPDLARWREHVAFLREPGTPKTYLAVTATLLTARSMFDASSLDVRAIKAGKHPLGYSASSVAGRLASFAKEQRIDLRATSTQPMNNQPFTFKDYLSPDISVQEKFQGQWRRFNQVVDEIGELTSGQARRVLALVFHLARRVDAPTISVRVDRDGKESLDAVCDALAAFVDTHSDGGRVGQAFAAAVLDLVYSPDAVVLGDTQDPDATVPGDVQVEDEAGTWLWTEVKQKVVTTGDVQGFIRKVHAAGGERVVYAALVNSGYSGNIQRKPVESEARRLGMGVEVIDSPRRLLDQFVPLAAGSYRLVAGRLLERAHARMAQAGCAAEVLEEFTSVASGVGDVRKA